MTRAADKLTKAIEGLEQAQATWKAGVAVLESGKAGRRRAIQAALDAGVTRAQVANILGLSPGRITQIVDEGKTS